MLWAIRLPFRSIITWDFNSFVNYSFLNGNIALTKLFLRSPTKHTSCQMITQVVNKPKACKTYLENKMLYKLLDKLFVFNIHHSAQADLVQLYDPVFQSDKVLLPKLQVSSCTLSGYNNWGQWLVACLQSIRSFGPD